MVDWTEKKKVKFTFDLCRVGFEDKHSTKDQNACTFHCFLFGIFSTANSLKSHHQLNYNMKVWHRIVMFSLPFECAHAIKPSHISPYTQFIHTQIHTHTRRRECKSFFLLLCLPFLHFTSFKKFAPSLEDTFTELGAITHCKGAARTTYIHNTSSDDN